MADSIETLGDYEVFPFELNWKSELKSSIAGVYSLVEYDGTVPVVTSYKERKPITIVQNIHLYSQTDIKNFLEFFDARKGRLHKFWAYLRSTDFTLATDISSGSGSITVMLNGYADVFSNYDRIYLQRSNNDVIVRRVTDAVDNEVNKETTITVTPTIDTSVAVPEVVRFGRVLMCRFDIDIVSLKYHTSAIAEVSVRLLELPTEYPAT